MSTVVVPPTVVGGLEPFSFSKNRRSDRVDVCFSDPYSVSLSFSIFLYINVLDFQNFHSKSTEARSTCARFLLSRPTFFSLKRLIRRRMQYPNRSVGLICLRKRRVENVVRIALYTNFILSPISPFFSLRNFTRTYIHTLNPSERKNPKKLIKSR